jgi:hypothetical protein
MMKTFCSLENIMACTVFQAREQASKKVAEIMTRVCQMLPTVQRRGNAFPRLPSI